MATRRSTRLSLSAASNGESTTASPAMPPPSAPQPRKRKAAKQADAPDEPAPVTPRKKRTPAPRASTPPATPTPGGAGLFAQPAANGPVTPRPRHAAVNRLADPEGTNAPLLSPETSRIVASKPIDLISPSKVSAATTTTANLLEEACAHLIKTDARMKPLVEAHHCRVFSPEGLAEKIDPFESLCSGIISQQVSGAAAKAIKGRFIALFDDVNGDKEQAEPPTSSAEEKKRFPHPSQVAATSIERLRSAGLSQRKAEYLQGLAEKFSTGELSAQLLADAPYDELLERLIAVRGLGRWSVEMFACFGLKRMDVFSLGDLGVQRGMAAFVGRDVAKLKAGGKGGKWKYMTGEEMEKLAEPFRPYRSLFMWYMWRVEETDISTME